MLKSETTTINGVEYEVTQLPYSQGKTLLVRLYKVLGPPLADAIAQAPGVSGDAEVSLTNFSELSPAISAVVRTLATTVTEKDFDAVVSTLAQFSKVANDQGVLVPLKSKMEFLFSGNYSALFAWLGFALKVNYSDFFGGQGPLATLLAKAKARPQKVSPSPSGLTGMSTESPPVSDTPAD